MYFESIHELFVFIMKKTAFSSINYGKRKIGVDGEGKNGAFVSSFSNVFVLRFLLFHFITFRNSQHEQYRK